MKQGCDVVTIAIRDCMAAVDATKEGSLPEPGVGGSPVRGKLEGGSFSPPVEQLEAISGQRG